MGRAGLEHTPDSPGKQHVSETSGSNSGNIGADSGNSEPSAPIPPAPPPLPADPDLAAIVAAWPTLPNAIKAGVLALVHAATDRPTSSPSSPKPDPAA